MILSQKLVLIQNIIPINIQIYYYKFNISSFTNYNIIINVDIVPYIILVHDAYMLDNI